MTENPAPKNPVSNNNQACPLCGHSPLSFYYQDKKRDYWQCSCCQLVSVAPDQYVSVEREKAEYDLHQNDCDDPGYRQFLSRLLTPLLNYLPENCQGLDFGCGPGPALAAMLREKGFVVACYDKFYQPDTSVLAKHYDFITATEVLEHLAEPGKVLDQLWEMLAQDGLLAVMTKRVKSQQAFQQWHYKQDPTHIVFFADQTMQWLAQRWQASIPYQSADVVIFKKDRLA